MMKTMNKAEIYHSPMLDELMQEISPEELERTEKRMLLAARIDDAIKAKGWKKKDFAEALGKTPSEISKWLSGTHNFTADTLFDIAKVLNIVLIQLEITQTEVVKVYHYIASSKAVKPILQDYGHFETGLKKTYSAKKQFISKYTK
jgi:transcriptional regulator with XRE-family HTH domain